MVVAGGGGREVKKFHIRKATFHFKIMYYIPHEITSITYQNSKVSSIISFSDIQGVPRRVHHQGTAERAP